MRRVVGPWPVTGTLAVTAKANHQARRTAIVVRSVIDVSVNYQRVIACTRKEEMPVWSFALVVRMRVELSIETRQFGKCEYVARKWSAAKSPYPRPSSVHIKIDIAENYDIASWRFSRMHTVQREFPWAVSWQRYYFCRLYGQRTLRDSRTWLAGAFGVKGGPVRSKTINDLMSRECLLCPNWGRFWCFTQSPNFVCHRV